MTKFQKFQKTRKYWADLADCRNMHDYEVSGPGFTYVEDSFFLMIDPEGTFSTIIECSNPVSSRLEDIELELFEYALDACSTSSW